MLLLKKNQAHINVEEWCNKEILLNTYSNRSLKVLIVARFIYEASRPQGLVSAIDDNAVLP
jgi:hypothetical protein